MDIVRFYDDHAIPYQTEGHKHCRPGWVNIECPFCAGNPGLHLGYDLSGNYFVCWRCGWKSNVAVVSKLLGISPQEAKIVVKQYGGKSRQAKKAKVQINLKKHKAPSGLIPLTNHHRNYLAKRGFIPEQLEEEWQLQSTGPMSLLDGINYSHRIFIPIFWEGRRVSYQTRTTNPDNDLRYMACPEEREEIKHKHILYKHKHPDFNNRRCICVEGDNDVWRLGRNAVATLGIKYTQPQLRLLSQYDEVIVLFDSDPQAIEQAKKLVAELRFRGTKASQYIIDGDPGDLSQEEADKLVKKLL